MQHLQEQQQKNKQALDGHNLNDHDLNSTQSSDKNSTKVTHQPSLSPGNADKGIHVIYCTCVHCTNFTSLSLIVKITKPPQKSNQKPVSDIHCDNIDFSKIFTQF